MNINIIKATGTTNTDYYSKLTRKYIVLHYTAGTSSKKGSARNIASMFKDGSVGGSADFIVDDAEIVQYNGDIAHRACWAVGGDRYTKMSTSVGGKYYNKCTNTNSLNIEMCSNKTNKKSLLASDTDWYLTDATVNNAVELTKYLMEQYNIPVENVIMHHHVTGKVCPNPWCVNESRLSYWNNFKARLTQKQEVDDEVIETGTITVNGKNIKIEKIIKDGTTYIKLRGLEAAGFEVDYDVGSKNLILNNKINELHMVVDGKETSIEAVNIDGYNYSPLRSVAAATGNFEVGYENNKVTIKTK